MTFKINTSMTKGEITVDPDADIFDTLDAFTAALIAEGYRIDNIAEAYYVRSQHLGFSPYDTKGND